LKSAVHLAHRAVYKDGRWAVGVRNRRPWRNFSLGPEFRTQIVGRKYLVPCTADLVGLWPVSDEVSPLSSVLEQSSLFDLFQCGSSRFDGLLDVLHPTEIPLARKNVHLNPPCRAHGRTGNGLCTAAVEVSLSVSVSVSVSVLHVGDDLKTGNGSWRAATSTSSHASDSSKRSA